MLTGQVEVKTKLSRKLRQLIGVVSKFDPWVDSEASLATANVDAGNSLQEMWLVVSRLNPEPSLSVTITYGAY